MLGVAALGWILYLAILSPRSLIATLVIGVTDGAIYALIALGYTMVYGIIELINFAHGDVFTLGGFVALPLFALFNIGPGSHFAWIFVPVLVLVFVAVMAINGLVNITIERIAYRPLRNAPRLAPLITAIGMSFILEGAMYIWQGANNVHYPDFLPAGRISLGGSASIGYKDVIVIALAVVFVAVLTAFINRSKLGKAMRATAQDQDAAQLMGININRTIAATFFIGAVLAGAGGIIFGLYFK